MFIVEDILDVTKKGIHDGVNVGEKWHRLGIIKDPLALLDAIHRKKRLSLSGKAYNPSDYLLMLAYNGLKCHGMCCTSQEAFMSLEQHGPKHKVLIRAFVKKDNREVMLTKDHDVAKSLGGPNLVENLKPLCYECNNLKSALETRLVSINTKWPHLKDSLPLEIKILVEDFANLLSDEKNKKKLSMSNMVIHCNLSAHEEPDEEWNVLHTSVGAAFGFTEKGFHYFIKNRPGNTHWKSRQQKLLDYPFNLWKRIERVELPKTNSKTVSFPPNHSKKFKVR